MKNLIIFDFFGVVCSEVAPFWLERYFNQDKARQIKSGLIDKADRGQITETEMFQTLATMTGKRALDVREEWLELAVIDYDVLKLIKGFREKYQIVLLSNAPASFLREILERDHLEIFFDQIIISSEERVAKPDARIFLMVLERMHIQPKQAILIDDNPNNLTGAKMVGIAGILFVNKQNFDAEYPDILLNCFGDEADKLAKM